MRILYCKKEVKKKMYSKSPEFIKRDVAQHVVCYNFVEDVVSPYGHNVWKALCKLIHDENKRLLQKAKQ